MDFLQVELSPCSETSVTSTHGGNEFTGIKVERVTDVTDEEDQDPTTIPVMKKEPKVSCRCVVSVRHISYRLYPELPATISVCPCNTKF